MKDKNKISLGYIEASNGIDPEAFFNEILGDTIRRLTKGVDILVTPSIFGNDPRFNIVFVYDKNESYAHIIKWLGLSYSEFAEYVTRNTGITFYLRYLRDCVDEVDTENSNKIIVPETEVLV